MVYILNKLDPELFVQKNEGRMMDFVLWETTEERIRTIIKNERCRSIFSKKEVVNLFSIDQKIQMVQTSEIQLKPFDRIITWTSSGRFFVMEIVKYS